MALTDYKFWYIRRDDDGFITEAAVRFYEGDHQPVTVGGETSIKYVRAKRLKKNDLKHLDDKYVKESSGSDAKLYTQADFGQIKTDDELRAFLNGELAKDSKHEAIEEQKWRP